MQHLSTIEGVVGLTDTVDCYNVPCNVTHVILRDPWLVNGRMAKLFPATGMSKYSEVFLLSGVKSTCIYTKLFVKMLSKNSSEYVHTRTWESLGLNTNHP